MWVADTVRCTCGEDVLVAEELSLDLGHLQLLLTDGHLSKLKGGGTVLVAVVVVVVMVVVVVVVAGKGRID